MKYTILGLGNPGKYYAKQRHNAGFWVIDCLTKKLGITFHKVKFHNYYLASGSYKGEPVKVVKSGTYMNNSGQIIRSVLKKTGIPLEQLVVVCDNMDLAPGRCKLKKGGASAGHNGLGSIIEHAKRGDFYRLYIGIGRPERKAKVVQYVLGEPEPDEMELYESIIPRAVNGLLTLIKVSPEQAMNEINKKIEQSN